MKWILLLVAIVVCEDVRPIVKVEHGLLKGDWKVSFGGRKYATFQGIRYAKPPVESNRFKVSVCYFKS